MHKEKKIKQKKKELVSVPFLIGLLIFLILFPVSVVWALLWDNVIPRHQTRFASFESFREKSPSAMLAWEIPDSAREIKYYWGQDYFVRVSGYGMSLPNEKYEQVKQESLERYAAEEVIESEILYIYDKNGKIQVQKEWLKKYSIDYVGELFCEGENLEDYYILAYDYTYGGDISYFTGVLCNDFNNRIIEVYCKEPYVPDREERRLHWSS